MKNRYPRKLKKLLKKRGLWNWALWRIGKRNSDELTISILEGENNWFLSSDAVPIGGSDELPLYSGRRDCEVQNT